MTFILISGKARSGKDTFAAILKEELESEETTEKFPMLAMASVLKSRLKDDFGLNDEQLSGKLKEVQDTRYPKFQHSPVDIFTPGMPSITYWTPRELMQEYGEFFRHIQPTFWVNKILAYCNSNNILNAIFTDIRFPNEIDTMRREHNVIVIRIKRTFSDEITNPYHISETALDNYTNIDYNIDNDGTLEDLRTIAKQIKSQIISQLNI